METAFFKFYNDAKDKDKLISTSFIFTLSTVTTVCVVFLLFSDSFIWLFGFTENPLQMYLLISILFLDTISIVPMAYLRVKGKAVSYAIIKLTNVSAIVLITLFFFQFVPENKEFLPSFIISIQQSTELYNFMFIANLTGSLISFILLIKIIKSIKWSWDSELLKKMISYSWPIAVAGIAYLVNENIDKLLIGHFLGDDSTGVYSAAYKIAVLMSLYIMAFKLGAEPFFFNQYKKKNAKEMYANIMLYFSIVGGAILLGVTVFIDIFKLLIAPDYWSALGIVPIVLLANLALGIYHNLAIWYKLTGKTRFGMYFSVAGAVITIVLNILLIPIYGFISSAWITLIAYGFMVIISAYIGSKNYKVDYNWTKIIIYIAFSFGMAYTHFSLYRENYYISILFVSIYALVILLAEYKHIKQLLNR